MSRSTARALQSSLLAVAALAALSCADAPSAVDHATLHLAADAAAAKGGNSMNAAGLLKKVHAAAARYHSMKQAEKAGYVSTVDCIAVPALGGMGVHHVNESLVDPVFDPMQPEVMLYAPDANGKLKLVAVEYIVIKTAAPRPAFDGYQFDDGGTPVPVPHWSLHVWLYEDNPSGVHAPFNPNVSCPAPAT